MEKKTGWRAIIYDAPWAYFKKGQDGVIVSEDGKSCETVDDDKSNIIIMADENVEFVARSNGHVLLRQKGSDLFDIVCLHQEASQHTYELKCNKVTLNGCTAKYADFESQLEVWWLQDGRETLPCDNYSAITPTNADIHESYVGTSYTINVIAVRGGVTFSAQNECVINSADEPTNEYDHTEFSIDCIKSKSNIKKTPGSAPTCSIVPPSSKPTCHGGTVTFKVNKTSAGNDRYEIGLSCASATNYYNVMRCNNPIDTTTEQGHLTFSFIGPTDGSVYNVVINSDYITFYTRGTVSSITIRATETNNGKYKDITVDLT